MGKFCGRLVTLWFREFEVEKIIKEPRKFQAFSIREASWKCLFFIAFWIQMKIWQGKVGIFF